MKLALHRSIAFWFGLLVMAFICWAWRDSFLNRTITELRLIKVELRSGGLRVEYSLVRAPFGIFAKRSWEPHPDYPLNNWLPSPSLFEFPASPGRTHTKGNWLLFIPCWLTLLAAVAVWLALLMWRAKRRAPSSLAVPPPSPTG